MKAALYFVLGIVSFVGLLVFVGITGGTFAMAAASSLIVSGPCFFMAVRSCRRPLPLVLGAGVVGALVCGVFTCVLGMAAASAEQAAGRGGHGEGGGVAFFFGIVAAGAGLGIGSVIGFVIVIWRGLQERMERKERMEKKEKKRGRWRFAGRRRDAC